jgi:hypothetical protein
VPGFELGVRSVLASSALLSRVEPLTRIISGSLFCVVCVFCGCIVEARTLVGTRYALRVTRYPLRVPRLVPEILIAQADPEIPAAQELDDGLQFVPLFPGNPDLAVH